MKTYACSVYRKEKFYTEDMVLFKDRWNPIQIDNQQYTDLEEAKAAVLKRFKSSQEWLYTHHEYDWNEIKDEEWIGENEHVYQKEFIGSLDAHCMLVFHILVTEIETEEAVA